MDTSCMHSCETVWNFKPTYACKGDCALELMAGCACWVSTFGQNYTTPQLPLLLSIPSFLFPPLLIQPCWMWSCTCKLLNEKKKSVKTWPCVTQTSHTRKHTRTHVWSTQYHHTLKTPAHKPHQSVLPHPMSSGDAQSPSRNQHYNT